VAQRTDNPPSNGRGQSPLSLLLNAEMLRPVIQLVVAEVLAALEADRATLPDRLAYSEAEAARLLGLHQHQLRDERRRGRIAASRIVGGRIAYRREDLAAYLLERRLNGGDQ
jgi:hypothetical protein